MGFAMAIFDSRTMVWYDSDNDFIVTSQQTKQKVIKYENDELKATHTYKKDYYPPDWEDLNCDGVIFLGYLDDGY